VPAKIARWLVDGPKLSARRIARGLTAAELARRARVSERTLGRYENLAGVLGQLDQLRDVARVLHVPVEAIARPASEPPPADARPSAAASPGPFALTIEHARAVAKSQLEAMVALERTLPPPRAVADRDGKPVPVLTAGRFHKVYSAFGCYEGERFAMVGKVTRHHGASPTEAKMIGSKHGVAARFLLAREISGEVEIKITVHTATKHDTRALHKASDEERETCAIVKVVVAPEDVVKEEKGFEFFLSSKPLPWGFPSRRRRRARSKYAGIPRSPSWPSLGLERNTPAFSAKSARRGVVPNDLARARGRRID
jgi:transcriptional regulator with XRE-family HTH domain